jgi:glycerol kinase
MQLQADISGLPVRVSPTANLSALGAAHLAGLRLGWWSWAELENGFGAATGVPALQPGIAEHERATMRSVWTNEVARSRGLPTRARDNEKASS